MTYATTLTFYLHLRAKEKYAQRPETLRAHPIMTHLLTLKQSLATLEELDFFPADSEDEFDEEEFDEDEEEEGVGLDFDELDISEEFAGQIGRLEPQELSELLKDAIIYRNQRGIEAEQQEKPPKKKRKTAKDSSAPVQPIFDLVEPVFKSTKASAPKTSTQDSVSDVYGEALSLQHADAADKSARRKSLRFHTAKIESAGARRQGARQALGGDDDVPYRERRKEKDARILKEAKDRVKGQGGADLDDVEPEPRSNNEDEGADAEGYYNLVKKQSERRKEKKKADYEAKQAELRFVALNNEMNFLTDRHSDRTWLRRPRTGHALSQRLFLQIEDLHPTDQKVHVIPESGNAKSTKRQRKKLHLKRPLSKVACRGAVGTTRAKNLVYPKLSRVFAWHSMSFAYCLMLRIHGYKIVDGGGYHFGCRRAFLAASVFMPFDSRTACSSLNFLLVYLFASASSTSSSTIVLFRCDLGRLSALVVSNGVVEGTIVPTCDLHKFRIQWPFTGG